jgi:hypothetical protein
MKRVGFIAFMLVGTVGCNPNQQYVPYFGKWDGALNILEIPDGPNTPKDRERESLRGYLMIYGARQKFDLHLEGEQETLDITGQWRLEKDRLTLKASKIDIDDQGGEAFRDPNRKFIPAPDLRQAYGKTIVLKLSPDKLKLTGLKISVGRRIAIHEFSR